jgi:hypothetical protein
MLSAGSWQRSQQNTVLFVLIDSGGNEVAGLGTAWVIEISKAGAAFAVGGGTKSEISDGWYKYVTTAAEADTIGPVAAKITHASTVQQNLEYVVLQRNESAVEFTYTVTDSVTTNPIEGVETIFTTDIAGDNVVWLGHTDTFGIARDSQNQKPFLDPGTYYIWRRKSGYSFTDPDTEVVS